MAFPERTTNMRRIIPILLIAFLLFPAGCRRQGSEGTVEGPEGEKLKLGVPEKTVIAQGAEKKFSVGIQREKVQGEVKITFEDPSDGLSIAEKEGTIPEDQNQIFFTLKAAPDAKLVKEKKLKVHASLGDMKTSAWMTVTVEESLDTKVANKKAYVEATKKRLEDVENQLKSIQEKTKGLKDDSKAEFLKRLSHLVEDKDHAKKKFNDLVADPVEHWNRTVPEVNSALNSLEKSTKKLQDEVNEKIK